MYEMAYSWWLVHPHKSCSRRICCLLDGSCCHSSLGPLKASEDVFKFLNFLWSGSARIIIDNTFVASIFWQNKSKKEVGGFKTFFFSVKLILKFQSIWDGILLPICFESWAQKEKIHASSFPYLLGYMDGKEQYDFRKWDPLSECYSVYSSCYSQWLECNTCKQTSKTSFVEGSYFRRHTFWLV